MAPLLLPISTQCFHGPAAPTNINTMLPRPHCSYQYQYQHNASPAPLLLPNTVTVLLNKPTYLSLYVALGSHVQRVLRHHDLREGTSVAIVIQRARYPPLSLSVRRGLLPCHRRTHLGEGEELNENYCTVLQFVVQIVVTDRVHVGIPIIISRFLLTE